MATRSAVFFNRFKLFGRPRRSLRRLFAGLTLGLAALTAGQPASAQSGYPNRPVRVLVAFAPGGIADIIARLVSQKLTDLFGQNFLVENRGGAGGAVAAKLAASSPADGYTLLVTTTAVAINAVAMKGAIDPHTQLTPIAIAARSPMIFAVNRAVTAPNLMDYVRGVKKGRFTFSSSGVGTAEDLTSEYIFKAVPGLDATHIPYSGGADTLNAVLGQQVDVAATDVPPALPFIKDGSLRIVASVSHKRLSMLPDVPTIGEIGFPDLETSSWIAFFGPPNLPADMAKSLNAAINKALMSPDINNRLTGLGFLVQPQDQPETVEVIKQDIAKWREIVEKTGFKPN